ncbi:MAG: NAD(P)/FAD-dependent oxidoreductase [Nitrospirota bacterium]|nr:NAD(P)/FAD-dependent oxidoreductase [Nitrospirota bacterium]
MNMTHDVIIIGAGASGLMCAIEAGRRGRRVLVLDHAKKPGNKIRVSGGGRCNFTNLHASTEHYISQNRYFCTSALKRFPPAAFVAMLEKHGIPFHEEDDSQLFCDRSAEDVLKMLLSECRETGAEVRTGVTVDGINKDDGFLVDSSEGRFSSESLVIATGGLSYRQLGASPFGYRIAEQFGLNVIPPKPALVPFTLSPKELDSLKNLAGIALDAVVTVGRKQFPGRMLFTHRGLSGPAILKASSFWNEGEETIINLFPDFDLLECLIEKKSDRPKAELKTILSELLPKRFVEYACETWFESGPMGQLSDKILQKNTEYLTQWIIKPNGTEGYRTAEVTRGGVDTKELSSKTMEAAKVKGLYFIGEVVDVTGELGGYNLQWAWSSGWCAGQFA